jgi:hypothetical protein
MDDYLPIQRDGNGSQPRTDTRPQGTPPDNIRRTRQRPHLPPCRAIHAVDVDQHRHRQQRHVRGAQKGMSDMRREGGTEEDEEDGQHGRPQEESQR